jgi:hypothetical protein
MPTMRVSRDRTTILLALACLTGAANAADGPRLHRNDEFGMAARFPAGARVCVALSGDHPVGFYAWLDARTQCHAARPPSVSAMTITASYNSAFENSAIVHLECRNGSVPRRSGLDLRGLAIPRTRGGSCAVRRRDGSLEVFVAAQGGNWGRLNRSSGSGAPRINYYAVLKTRPERLARDMARFRAFLARMEIRPPQFRG